MPSPRLAVNVFAAGIGYGPSFGDTVPPSDLWGQFEPDVWGEPPPERGMLAPATGGLVSPEEAAQISAATASADEGSEAYVPRSDQPPQVLADAATALPDPAPDPLEALRAEAATLGIQVDGRWGARRLAREIQAAREGTEVTP